MDRVLILLIVTTVVFFVLFVTFLLLWILWDDKGLPREGDEDKEEDCRFQSFPLSKRCLEDQVSIDCSSQELPVDRLSVNPYFTNSALIFGNLCEKGIALSDLEDLASKVRMVFPWNDAYNSLRLNNNQAIQLFPMGISYPTSDEQVSKVVKWCSQHKIQMTVRSGGHSYESLSLCRGIVIDQGDRKEINVKENNQITAESGVSIGLLVSKLHPLGLVVPTGTCATVHLFGLALGGGIGFLNRKLGLTSDNVLSVRYVLADGSIVDANSKDHSDLYWAARGAGSAGFGVATSITLHGTVLNHPICLYSITWSNKDIFSVLSAWQDFAPFTIDDLSSEFNIFPGDRDIEMTGQYVGSMDDCKALLKPMLSVGKPTSVKIWHTTFDEGVRYFSGTQRRTQYYKNKSDFVTNKLPREAIEILANYMRDMPFPDMGDRVEMDAFGGQVNRYSISETAFPHRHHILFWMQYVNRTDNVYLLPTKTEWLEKMYRDISPFVSGDTYWNCPDLQLSDPKSTRKPFPECYYGPNVPRLKAIKAKYDPDNSFYFPQSITL